MVTQPGQRNYLLKILFRRYLLQYSEDNGWPVLKTLLAPANRFPARGSALGPQLLLGPPAEVCGRGHQFRPEASSPSLPTEFARL